MLAGGTGLATGVGVVIEIIRKNNSDYDLIPITYTTLESHPPSTRDPIYLGTLVRIFAENMPKFHDMLTRKHEEILKTPFGQIEPLGFERFKICELVAELLHCSNMALLNDEGGAEIVRIRDKERNRVKRLLAKENNPELEDYNYDINGDSDDEEEEEGNENENENADKSNTDTTKISSSSSSSDNGTKSSTTEESSTTTKSTPLSHLSEEDEEEDSLHVVEKELKDEDNDEDEDSKSSKDAHGKVEDISATSSNSEKSTVTLESEPNPDAKQDENFEEKFKTLQVEEEDGENNVISSPYGDFPSVAMFRKNPVVGDKLKLALYDNQIITYTLNMFFRFAWNNFLHNVVFDIVQQVLNGPMSGGFNRYLAIDLFDRGRLTFLICEGQQQCAEYQTQHKTRLGYMGHLTLISEEVVKFTAIFKPEAISPIVEKAVENEEWVVYVSETLTRIREQYNAILGGQSAEESPIHINPDTIILRNDTLPMDGPNEEDDEDEEDDDVYDGVGLNEDSIHNRLRRRALGDDDDEDDEENERGSRRRNAREDADDDYDNDDENRNRSLGKGFDSNHQFDTYFSHNLIAAENDENNNGTDHGDGESDHQQDLYFQHHHQQDDEDDHDVLNIANNNNNNSSGNSSAGNDTGSSLLYGSNNLSYDNSSTTSNQKKKKRGTSATRVRLFGGNDSEDEEDEDEDDNSLNDNQKKSISGKAGDDSDDDDDDDDSDDGLGLTRSESHHEHEMNWNTEEAQKIVHNYTRE